MKVNSTCIHVPVSDSYYSSVSIRVRRFSDWLNVTAECTTYVLLTLSVLCVLCDLWCFKETCLAQDVYLPPWSLLYGFDLDAFPYTCSNAYQISA